MIPITHQIEYINDQEYTTFCGNENSYKPWMGTTHRENVTCPDCLGVEVCKTCEKPVRMIAMSGTGYCSLNCSESGADSATPETPGDALGSRA